jgi:hypothetical protein
LVPVLLVLEMLELALLVPSILVLCVIDVCLLLSFVYSCGHLLLTATGDGLRIGVIFVCFARKLVWSLGGF